VCFFSPHSETHFLFTFQHNKYRSSSFQPPQPVPLFSYCFFKSVYFNLHTKRLPLTLVLATNLSNTYSCVFPSFFSDLTPKLKSRITYLHTFLHFLQVVEIFAVQTLASRPLCPYLYFTQLHNISAYILVVVLKVDIFYGSKINNCEKLVSYLLLNFTIFTGFVICEMVFGMHNRAKQLN